MVHTVLRRRPEIVHHLTAITVIVDRSAPNGVIDAQRRLVGHQKAQDLITKRLAARSVPARNHDVERQTVWMPMQTVLPVAADLLDLWKRRRHGAIHQNRVLL